MIFELYISEINWKFLSYSTLSSALNSLAAVFLEDIVKSFNPLVTETAQTRISKIVGRWKSRQ